MERNNKPVNKKKIRFTTILKIVFFGDDDPEFIAHQQESAVELNFPSLLITNILALLSLILIYILSFFLDIYKTTNRIDLIFIIIFTLSLIFEATFLRKHRKYSTLCYYFFIYLAYLYILIVSSVYFSDTMSPWLNIMMALVPTLLFTYPYFHYLTNTTMALVYIVLCWMLKSQDIALRETIITSLTMSCSNFITLILVYQRVSALRIRHKFERDSNTDDLTGLPNRRAINLRIDETNEKTGEYISGMIMLDIDNFKAYNDTYGHIKGDQALIKIGDALDKISKKYGIFIGRYGGEEFLVLVNFINLQNIETIAQDILNTVKELNIQFEDNPNKNNKILTVSAGIAKAESGDDALDVLNNADIALYESKSKGKDIVSEKK